MKYFSGLESVPDYWLHSAFNQARYLTKNVELDIQANHYFKNGKADFYANEVKNLATSFQQTSTNSNSEMLKMWSYMETK